MLTDEPAAHTALGRHLRSGVTLSILLAVVVGAGWYGLSSLRDEPAVEDGDTTVTTNDPNACPEGQGSPAPAVAPADISVNVYNATQRNGLASATARQLREQGFVIVDVANDPLRKAVPGVAEVRAKDDSLIAYLVLAYVPGATFASDTRTDNSVDLVVGDQFQAITVPAAPPAPPLVC
jgi:LytR cell envelope-related transcriptional attenuator